MNKQCKFLHIYGKKLVDFSSRLQYSVNHIRFNSTLKVAKSMILLIFPWFGFSKSIYKNVVPGLEPWRNPAYFGEFCLNRSYYGKILVKHGNKNPLLRLY